MMVSKSINILSRDSYTLSYIYIYILYIVLFNIANYTDVIFRSTWCLQEDVILWKVDGLGVI